MQTSGEYDGREDAPFQFGSGMSRAWYLTAAISGAHTLGRCHQRVHRRLGLRGGGRRCDQDAGVELGEQRVAGPKAGEHARDGERLRRGAHAEVLGVQRAAEQLVLLELLLAHVVLLGLRGGLCLFLPFTHFLLARRVGVARRAPRCEARCSRCVVVGAAGS